ncbi:unnamed protein product [Darwinula stevensoni]|uniref:Uncharacterized protein n=1 Tax=Darwinula stevensoni TaxID=69355 RepID=A0A7R8X680_9CRUS|nr:unnamed protein product [Darwinula stevensoni]CAG0879174.1 unnamed protein product [Darwinula stevensoni]
MEGNGGVPLVLVVTSVGSLPSAGYGFKGKTLDFKGNEEIIDFPSLPPLPPIPRLPSLHYGPPSAKYGPDLGVLEGKRPRQKPAGRQGKKAKFPKPVYTKWTPLLPGDCCGETPWIPLKGKSSSPYRVTKVQKLTKTGASKQLYDSGIQGVQSYRFLVNGQGNVENLPPPGYQAGLKPNVQVSIIEEEEYAPVGALDVPIPPPSSYGSEAVVELSKPAPYDVSSPLTSPIPINYNSQHLGGRKEQPRYPQAQKQEILYGGPQPQQIQEYEALGQNAGPQGQQYKAPEEVIYKAPPLVQYQEQRFEAPRQVARPVEQKTEVPREQFQFGQQKIEVPREEFRFEQQSYEAPRHEVQFKQQRFEAPRQEVRYEQQRIEAPRQEVQFEQQRYETHGQEEQFEQQRFEAPRQEVRYEQQRFEAPRQEVRYEQQRFEAPRQEVRFEQQRIEAPRQEVRFEQQRYETHGQEEQSEEQRFEAPRQEVRFEQQRFEAPRQEVRFEQQRHEAPRQEVRFEQQRFEAPRQEVRFEHQRYEAPRQEVRFEPQRYEAHRQEEQSEEQRFEIQRQQHEQQRFEAPRQEIRYEEERYEEPRQEERHEGLRQRYEGQREVFLHTNQAEGQRFDASREEVGYEGNQRREEPIEKLIVYNAPREEGRFDVSREEGRYDGSREEGRFDGSREEGRFDVSREEGRYDGSREEVTFGQAQGQRLIQTEYFPDRPDVRGNFLRLEGPSERPLAPAGVEIEYRGFGSSESHEQGRGRGGQREEDYSEYGFREDVVQVPLFNRIEAARLQELRYSGRQEQSQETYSGVFSTTTTTTPAPILSSTPLPTSSTYRSAVEGDGNLSVANKGEFGIKVPSRSRFRGSTTSRLLTTTTPVTSTEARSPLPQAVVLQEALDSSYINKFPEAGAAEDFQVDPGEQQIVEDNLFEIRKV